MSLTTLTVDGNDYESYSSIDEADTYLRVEATLYGGWNGLSDTEKSIRLISATRRIDLLPWAGMKASATQETKWPRSGVKHADGSDVPDDVIPTAIETAVIWMAGNVRLALSPVADLSGQESDVMSRRVGPRSVSYFHRQRDGLDRQLPPRILQLVGEFLASTAAVGGVGIAFDGVEESGFRDLHEVVEGIS